MSQGPAVVWFRQDLRLADNPALRAAVDRRRGVVPVYIWAPDEEGDWPPGGAAKVWLHQSLGSLQRDLDALGSRLLVLRGPTLATLRRVIRATGASAVYWNRRYEPAVIARDTQVKQALHDDGLEVESFNGSLLWEPWTVKTRAGDPYQVFTPFWKTVSQMPEPGRPLDAPTALQLPDGVPDDDGLEALDLLPKIDWHTGIVEAWAFGEAGAHDRLGRFLDHGLADYDTMRNRPDADGSSRLSPYLHHGELSPRQVWHAVRHRIRSGAGEALRKSAWSYLREIAWREFAYHLLYHFPHTPTKPLREEFGRFPWASDDEAVGRWQRGRTGYPIVDAGLRQLWQTGWMHNRVRMIAGSFLVKDLRVSWLEGARWFWDTLVDADLANNTLGWQWVGGCGADAAPYFRVFNPVLQGRKFDPEGQYVRAYVPEVASLDAGVIHEPWEAGVPPQGYVERLVDHHEARDAALAAYEKVKRSR